MNVIYRKFKTRDYHVEKWNKNTKTVLVDGCSKCKECCGHFYQPLVLLNKKDNHLFYNYLDLDVPCIHPDKGCKQMGKSGCKCPPKQKPILCKIFPYRLIGKKVQAHVLCPAVVNTPLTKLQEIGLHVANYLITLPHDFLFNLSEEIPVVPQMVDLNIELAMPGTGFEVRSNLAPTNN